MTTGAFSFGLHGNAGVASSFERCREAGGGTAADLRPSGVPSLRKKPRVFLLRSALVFYAAEPPPASRHLGNCQTRRMQILLKAQGSIAVDLTCSCVASAACQGVLPGPAGNNLGQYRAQQKDLGLFAERGYRGAAQDRCLRAWVTLRDLRKKSSRARPAPTLC